MAKAFIYDAVRTIDANTIDGSRGDPDDVTFAAAARLIDEHLINDNSIASPVTGWADDEVLQYVYPASVSATHVAIHTNAEEENNVLIHVADSEIAMGAAIVTHSDKFEIGWSIIDLGGTESGQYWYIVSDGGFTGMTEAFVAKQYQFDTNPSLGGTEAENFGVNVVHTWGGIGHSNKRHDGRTEWTWQWEFLSAGARTSLEAWNNAIEGTRLKFLYYDETSYYWVRQTSKLVFTQTAFQAYNTSVTLLEQLS